MEILEIVAHNTSIAKPDTGTGVRSVWHHTCPKSL